MKMSLFLIFFFNAFTILAQDFKKVDREIIKKEVTDPASSFYYSKLLERFNSFDSLLTDEEYRHLYYGFVFQKQYSGYPDQKKKEIIEKINDKNYKKAISFCDDVLKEIPVSL